MDLINRLIKRLQASEEVVLVLASILVGVGAGTGAVIFRYLIRGVEWIGYDWFPLVMPWMGKAYVLLIPAVGGVLVGLLVFNFAREAKGHGVPEVMEAVALKGGRIRPIVAVIKSLASSLCIGSGGSVGREGPIVQIGSAIGSTIGQAFHLSDNRIRNLVACGAAGGIAATFNAPIAGVVFAIEIILGEFSGAHFSTIIISAVSASVIGQAIFGSAPAFLLPMEYNLNSVWEFAFYPVLGVLAAVIGFGFVHILYWSEDLFEKRKEVPEWLQPALGGALLGILALAYPIFSPVSWDRLPQVFNVGYEVIESTLQNEIVLGVVIVLLFLKLAATSLTLGSGGSGGIFAPSLFMGAMLGAAFGLVVNAIFPLIPAPPGAYALVGMAAVFSAVAHAPMTAVIIVFELTGDYRIILPLMLTVGVATLLSRILLKGESIYTLKLSRRGIHLKAGRDVDILQGVFVSDVMTSEFDTVSHDMTIVELSETFSRIRRNGFPVLDSTGKLWGMVTINDLEIAVQQNIPRRAKVSEIGTPFNKLVLAHPDDTIGDILLKMGPSEWRWLPIVSPLDPRQLIGLIRHEDVIRAYNVAMMRRSELIHRVKRAELRASESAEFVEIQLTERDKAVGRTIADIAPDLPEDSIIVSINRESQIIIPHGDTTLQAGDHLTAYTRKGNVQTLYHYLKGH